jgi:hypothetical protein
MELKATMFPGFIPGVRGNCNDEQDLVSDDPEDLHESRQKISTAELTEIGRVWLREFTDLTKMGAKIKHSFTMEGQCRRIWKMSITEAVAQGLSQISAT